MKVLYNVVAIMNAQQAIVAEYVYDAWGNILAITDASGNDISGNATHIANLNPIRYRGYFYDVETGFYYLQSRYYDPVIGRFINLDGFVTTGQGFLSYNMYAYCANNPTNYSDYSGYCFHQLNIFKTCEQCQEKKRKNEIEGEKDVKKEEKLHAKFLMISLLAFRLK